MKGILLFLITYTLTFGGISAQTATHTSDQALAIQRVRIAFQSPSGNIRPLLLGFTSDGAATDGVDYGYDAKNNDSYPNDLNWIIEGDRYLIQGVGSYHPDKYYELGLWLEETGTSYIGLTGLENFNTEIPVYIYDAQFDDFTQINDTPFAREIEPGTHLNRFFLAFSTTDITLNIDDPINTTPELGITYNKNDDVLNISSNFDTITDLSLYTIDGKLIYDRRKLDSQYLELPMQNFNSQVLIVIAQIGQSQVVKKFVAK